jgi:hypothetical protein
MAMRFGPQSTMADWHHAHSISPTTAFFMANIASFLLVSLPATEQAEKYPMPTGNFDTAKHGVKAH